MTAGPGFQVGNWQSCATISCHCPTNSTLTAADRRTPSAVTTTNVSGSGCCSTPAAHTTNTLAGNRTDPAAATRCSPHTRKSPLAGPDTSTGNGPPFATATFPSIETRPLAAVAVERSATATNNETRAESSFRCSHRAQTRPNAPPSNPPINTSTTTPDADTRNDVQRRHSPTDGRDNGSSTRSRSICPLGRAWLSRPSTGKHYLEPTAQRLPRIAQSARGEPPRQHLEAKASRAARCRS